jgi:hypothetical protein
MIKLFLIVLTLSSHYNNIQMFKLPRICPYTSDNNTSKIELIECSINEICCQEEINLNINNNNNTTNFIPQIACCPVKKLLLENLLFTNTNLSVADISLNISRIQTLPLTSSSISIISITTIIIIIIIGITLIASIIITFIFAFKYFKVKSKRILLNILYYYFKLIFNY